MVTVAEATCFNGEEKTHRGSGPVICDGVTTVVVRGGQTIIPGGNIPRMSVPPDQMGIFNRPPTPV
jgi:hypothetical protein